MEGGANNVGRLDTLPSTTETEIAITIKSAKNNNHINKFNGEYFCCNKKGTRRLIAGFSKKTKLRVVERLLR